MSYLISNIIDESDLQVKLIEYTFADFSDLNVLTQAEKNVFLAAKSTKRQCEIYYSRVLWEHFKIDQKIHYDENGKPHLNKGFLSISHASRFVTIAYSNAYSCGIDIEIKNPKLEKISSRYINPAELKYLNETNLNNLTLLWSIKEATFKFLGLQNVFFKDMLIVQELTEDGGIIRVNHPLHKEDYAFSYLDLADKNCILSFISN